MVFSPTIQSCSGREVCAPMSYASVVISILAVSQIQIGQKVGTGLRETICCTAGRLGTERQTK